MLREQVFKQASRSRSYPPRGRVAQTHYGKITCLFALFGVKNPRKRIALAVVFALNRTKIQAIFLESHLGNKPLRQFRNSAWVNEALEP